MYDKPFLTYEEQIEKLKSVYDLEISNNIAFEVEILKTISYYDLVNGYKDCFMENDKFIDKITLGKLFAFNIIDKKFQNILFLYSVYVENIFKNKIAHLLGKTRGIEFAQYLDVTKYHSPNPLRKKKLEDTINDMISVHNKSKDDPTKYYRYKHNHIPPWILFKNVKFTTIIDLFSFLKKDEKLLIITEYEYFNTEKISDDEKIELFRNMITIIRKFRNKIAHNYKIIGTTIDKNMLHLRKISYISPHKLLSNNDIKKKRGENDLYAMIISLLFLLEPILLKILFTHELGNFHFTDADEYFKKCNFPNNFKENMKKICEDLSSK